MEKSDLHFFFIILLVRAVQVTAQNYVVAFQMHIVDIHLPFGRQTLFLTTWPYLIHNLILQH